MHIPVCVERVSLGEQPVGLRPPLLCEFALYRFSSFRYIRRRVVPAEKAMKFPKILAFLAIAFVLLQGGFV